MCKVGAMAMCTPKRASQPVPEQQKADAERQLCCVKRLFVSQSFLLSSRRHMQLQRLETGNDWVQKRVIARTSANISDLFTSHCDALSNALKWGFVYFSLHRSYCLSFPSSHLHAEVLGNHLPRNGVLRRVSATLACSFARQVDHYPRRTPRA
jgi:hypothetical protein